MKMSEDIKEFAVAFSKAQGMMRAASKDAENPFYKASYATLASVMEAIREPFLQNGLSFLQPCKIIEENRVVVETIILHSSGQYIIGEVTATPVKNDPQATGSLISYLKRYLLQAMVGIATADDDSETAMGRGVYEHPKKITPPKVQAPPLSMHDQFMVKFSKFTDRYTNKDKVAKILECFNVKSSKEIAALGEDQLKDMLIKIDEFNT
jgi:hypothetical protein